MPETNKNIKSLRKGVKDTKKNGKDTITEIKYTKDGLNCRLETTEKIILNLEKEKQKLSSLNNRK